MSIEYCNPANDLIECPGAHNYYSLNGFAARFAGGRQASLPSFDGKYVTLTACTWDKYGSRIDCDVWQDGQSVSDQMIAQKMAVPYNGKRKVHSWCKI
jgi:hypothetical protein